MKKSLIALLLVVALVVTVSVFAVSATEPEIPAQLWSNLTIAEDGQTATGYCPHCCESTDETVTWTLYTINTAKHMAIKDSGHFFLNASSNGAGRLAFGTAGVDFVLHLNGYTYQRGGQGVGSGNGTGNIYVGAGNVTVSVVDSEAGNGLLTNAQGYAINIASGTGSKVDLYSGNVTSTAAATHNSGLGGTVYLAAGSFNMYGGKITGATAAAKVARGGAIYAKNSSTRVNIYGGTIEGGVASSFGGCVYLENATMNLSGADTVIKNGEAGTYGGCVCVHGASANFYMTGGTISGGTADIGGNVGLMQTGAYFEMTGGTLEGTGASGKGSNLGIFKGDAMIGGTATIQNGTAAPGKNGGNIYLDTAADTLTIEGNAVIKDGKAPDGCGGNIGLLGGELIINGGNIQNGQTYRVPTDEGGLNTLAQGGNIYTKGGDITMTGGTITGSNILATHGGNIFAEGSGDKITITGGTITGGKCHTRGGNIYTINGTLEITESTAEDAAQVAITNGSAGTGGAIFARNTVLTVSGDVSFSGNKSTNTKTPSVSASGVTSGGAVIWVDANGAGKTSTATLSGGTYNTDFGVVTDNATTITVGGTSKSYIWLANTDDEMADAATAAKVIVAEGFTGETKVGWAATSISEGVYGGQMAPLSLTQEAGYTGTGTIQALNQGRTGFPVADLEGEVTDTDNRLQILAFAGVKYNEEGKTTETPLADLSGDLSAYDVIKLYTKHNGDVTVEVPTDPTTWQTIEVPTGLIYDLNGRKVNLTITGEGKIDIIEPRTDDLDKKDVTNSKFTVSDITKLNRSSKNPATGYSYVAVQEMNGEEGTGMFTSNRVMVDITTVSIKPASASLYYTTSIGSNAKVAPYVNSYGVVLSLANMPTGVFDDNNGDEENDNMYTELGLEEELTASFEESHRSCIVANILKDELNEVENTARAALPIYANAFMCIFLPDMDAPIYVMADETYTHSLKGLVEYINTVESLYTNANVIDMYKKFQNPMATWNLDKIAAAAEA